MKNTTVLRKMIALALVLVLLLSMGGCGQRETDERDTPAEEATPTVTTPEPGGADDASGKGKKPVDTLPVQRVTEVARAEEGELKVIWLGHSSILLQMGTRNILCDPVFTTRISPVGVGGLNRFSEVPLLPEDVPEIDILFLSHDHYDHMDKDTILAIDGRVGIYVVPAGADQILIGWGIEEDKILTLTPLVSVVMSDLKLTMTPAQHSGGRTLIPTTLCGGVYISDGSHVVYYTGDGGYGEHFAQMYEELGAVDLLLAECGQYNENWAKMHMFPEQTAQVAVDVHATWMIPVHWGAFVLSLHSWDEPVTRCVAAAEKLGVKVATPQIGQVVDFDEIGSYTTHWWEEYR